jgi:hypothetical protein
MGKPNLITSDLAKTVQTVAVTSATTFQFSNPIVGLLNVAITGTFVATLQLENSFDGGTTWAPMSGSTVGTTATFTAPTQFMANEVEAGVLWRANCTAWTSGTANIRLSN